MGNKEGRPMKRNRIFVTRRIPEPGLERLKEHLETEVSLLDRNLTRDEILRMTAGYQGMVSMPTDSIDRDCLDGLSGIQIIANYAVGFNNIDIDYAREKGIVVTNTPGVLTEATADIAIALILCVARRIVEGDRLVRRGDFEGFYPTFFLGAELENKVLGIYGLGRIGKAVARKAVCFGLRIIYHDVEPLEQESLDFPAEYVSFNELLGKSDFLSIHALLSEETHHRFTRKEFKKMKDSAFLINAARGPLVKEEDFVHALENRLIAGAGLDVYEFEPKVHPGLIALENVVLLPHLGSATIEVREKMSLMVADNIIAFFQGKTPPNRVN